MVFGFNFSTPVPAVVLLQARQRDNMDSVFTDQFAIQVISTDVDLIEFRILRLDTNGGGWEQNLRVDIFVVE